VILKKQLKRQLLPIHRVFVGIKGELDYNINFEDILDRCIRGDLKAQEHLYKNYYGYVMGIALRFSSCRDNALEITNDSFLKIFRNIGSHQIDKEFKAWIRRIVVNSALDYYRREKKHDLEISIDKASDESEDESVLDKLNAEEIIRILNSLPAMYRYTFTLFEIEGFTHDEIAQQLGITASTSRSNLTRAKKMLRQIILTQYQYEGSV
jgi:RNA polymerase sigma factor (sigma-70 family)